MEEEYPDMDAALRALPNAIFATRGGTNQHSQFHATYLQLCGELLPDFHLATGHAAMRHVYDRLIRLIERGYHAKFLKRTRNGKWKEMNEREKRRKVSAVFRDENRRWVRALQQNENIALDWGLFDDESSIASIDTNGIDDALMNEALLENASLASDASIDCFDVVMQMLDMIMPEIDTLDDDDYEPVVIDYNNIVPK
jgi:hypothetical protein